MKLNKSNIMFLSYAIIMLISSLSLFANDSIDKTPLDDISSLKVYKLQNFETKRFLDSNEKGKVFTSVGVRLSQNWVIDKVGDKYHLKSSDTERFLNSDKNGKISTKPRNGTFDQTWIFKKEDSNVYYLQSRLTLDVLDSNNNGEVYSGPFSGNNYQRWLINKL